MVKPEIIEVELQKPYRFMYQTFVVSDQRHVFLFIGKRGDRVDVLQFESTIFKFGSPNDEALSGHPLHKFGLRHYGLYEVKNSLWIEELRQANRVHPNHRDRLYDGLRHFIASFKDVTFEVICDEMEEKNLSTTEVASLIAEQAENLDTI